MEPRPVRPVFLFTDFGAAGPYVGLMKAAIWAEAPQAPVIDLMADVPTFSPQAGAYLLAAMLAYLPDNAVVVAVVDPGVGSDRAPLVAEVDGRFLVGPDNGLFEIAVRRAGASRVWRIGWVPVGLSTSFHGRDLFAPVAARLAQGISVEAAGQCVSAALTPPGVWPDDLPAIVYVDHYGNAMTGLRATALHPHSLLRLGGHHVAAAGTFSAVRQGHVFWYVNSVGLIEIAVNQGRVADLYPEITVGSAVQVVSPG